MGVDYRIQLSEVGFRHLQTINGFENYFQLSSKINKYSKNIYLDENNNIRSFVNADEILGYFFNYINKIYDNEEKLTQYKKQLKNLKKELQTDYRKITHDSQNELQQQAEIHAIITPHKTHYTSLNLVPDNGVQINEAAIEKELNEERTKKPPTSIKSNTHKTIQQKTNPGGLTGPNNLGNTCYINSVINCIIHTKNFYEHILCAGNKSHLYR